MIATAVRFSGVLGSSAKLAIARPRKITKRSNYDSRKLAIEI
jgi:hypothetical protein